MAAAGRRPGTLAASLAAGTAAACVLVLWRGAGAEKYQNGPRFRLVSLAPSITECLHAVGAGGALVGVTESCDFPPEAAAVPKVGSFTAPDPERILALKPDAVLTTSRAPAPARVFLERNGVRVATIPLERLDDVPRGLQTVGEIAGRAAEGRAAAEEWRGRLAAIRSRGGRRPPRRIFLEIWHDPLTAPGASSFITEAIEAAGGASVTADLPGEYVRVSPDLVVRRRPDAIVLAYMGAAPAAGDVARRVGWEDLPAVREGRIIRDIDPSLLLRPGPRLIDGIEALRRRLEGD